MMTLSGAVTPPEDAGNGSSTEISTLDTISSCVNIKSNGIALFVESEPGSELLR